MGTDTTLPHAEQGMSRELFTGLKYSPAAGRADTIVVAPQSRLSQVTHGSRLTWSLMCGLPFEVFQRPSLFRLVLARNRVFAVRRERETVIPRGYGSAELAVR